MLVFLFILSQISFQPSGHWDLGKIGINSPGPFEVRPDGAVAVYSVKTGQLVFIDAKGNLKARCGAEGKGSGEFQVPRKIQWLAHEKVYAVYDITNRRVSKWDENGNLVGEFEIPKPLKDPLMPNNKVTLVSKFAQGFYGNKPTILVLNPKDLSSRIIFEHDLGGRVFGADPLEEEERLDFTLNMPWNPSMHYDVGSDFIATAYGDSNLVHLLDFEGKPIGTPIRVALPVFPLSDDQYIAAFKNMPEIYKKDPSKFSVRTSTWPVIRDIIVDDQNRIWIFGSVEGEGNPFPFEVYDANGKQLGSGKIGRIPEVISGKNMYAKETVAPILQKIDFTL